MKQIEEPLVKNLRKFVAFARNRAGDPQLAEDIVQESLLKALNAEKKPAREEDTIAWFYRILRRSIIDLYRRQNVRNRALRRFEEELSAEPNTKDERFLCRCFKQLLPRVPDQYRTLLERIDLNSEEISEVAADLRLTKNNLTVRLHRARKHLRDQLSRVCRTCSTHGCLDCTCN